MPNADYRPGSRGLLATSVQRAVNAGESIVAGGQISTAVVNANGIYTPIMLPADTYASLNIEITVLAGVGGVIRGGVYSPVSATRLVPGNLIADLGTLASDGTIGVKKFPLSLVWRGGPIFALFVSQNVPAPHPTVRTVLTPDFSSPLNLNIGGALNGKFFVESGILGALPAVAAPTIIGTVAYLCAFEA
jgi:hypothetical protein